MKMATLVYRVVLSTRSFRLINWYSLILARRGYTATYQLDRGWVLYPILVEPIEESERTGTHTCSNCGAALYWHGSIWLCRNCNG